MQQNLKTGIWKSAYSASWGPHKWISDEWARATSRTGASGKWAAMAFTAICIEYVEKGDKPNRHLSIEGSRDSKKRYEIQQTKWLPVYSHKNHCENVTEVPLPGPALYHSVVLGLPVCLWHCFLLPTLLQGSAKHQVLSQSLPSFMERKQVHSTFQCISVEFYRQLSHPWACVLIHELNMVVAFIIK